MAWQDAFKGFSIKKIGAGNKFRSGKGYNQRIGLDGAFRELKDPKYGQVGANLSSTEIKMFEKMLATKLRGEYTYTAGLNYKERRDMLNELEEKRQHGEISEEDLKDFRVIIDKLSV